MSALKSLPTKVIREFRVRRLRQADVPRVQELVSEGLIGIVPDAVKYTSSLWRFRGPTLVAMASAAYAATDIMGTEVPPMVAGAAAASGVAVAAHTLLRRNIQRTWEGYVKSSLQDDLGRIDSHYRTQVKAKAAEVASNGTLKKDVAITQVKNDGPNFWVCEVIEEKKAPYIVGCVGLDMHSESFPEDCEMRRLSVDPAYRQFGVARRLMDTVSGQMRELDAKRVWLEFTPYQPPASAAYARWGWVQDKAYDKSWNFHLLRMFLTVPPA